MKAMLLQVQLVNWSYWPRNSVLSLDGLSLAHLQVLSLSIPLMTMVDKLLL